MTNSKSLSAILLTLALVVVGVLAANWIASKTNIVS